VLNGNFDELKEITHILLTNTTEIRKRASECRGNRGDAMATLANIDEDCCITIDMVLPRLLKLVEE